MASAPRDVTQRMAVNKGQKAVPATLEFARFLASNATATAQRFQRQSFDYAHTSSNAVDSFANGIKAMIKKTQNFLHMMEEYSTETGIERLENMTDNFSVVAADDVTDVLMHAIDSKFDAMLKRASRATMTTLAQVSSEQFVEKAEFKMSGIWSQISLVLVSLQLALPAVVDDLKFARKEVSAVSQTLTNTFGAFKAKGPPIFYQVAALYSTLWVAYFTLFALLTVSVLFYGLWASGWFGGPQAAEADESYEPPQTFMDRCRACYASCNACVRGCQESSLCFWSVILVMEVLVLVLFLVSMVLCILAGVKAFLSAGCAQIYILGDDSICTGVLGTIKRWLLSFLANDRFLLEHACQEHTLLTCQLIGAKLKTSAVYTTVGSLLAAVLSFQMIVESAILHERARWRRIFDEESKRV